MDFSREDKDLLKALANLYNAVDIAAVTKACEAFRESTFRQRDRLAIGADTLRLFAQTRGKTIDLETKEWQEFFRLANDIEERGKRKRKGNNARQKRLRQLRILARLTVLWGPKALEHYGFTNWNFEKLDSLLKCAEQLPELVRFTDLANYFLLDRHDKSLTSNMSDRIGQHSFRNQHTKVASLLKPYQPLQNRDLDRILKFVQGKATLLINGHRCDTYEQLAQHSSRLEEWVQDDIGDVDVSGTKLKDYPGYQAKNYQLGYDIHGLLVPREYEDEACRRKRQRKRRREDHSETTDEEGMEISEDPAPDQKRTKAHPGSMYPSPPVSSPQESVLSSPPPSPMDSDSDSELVDESSSDGSPGTYPEVFGNSRSAEEDSSNVEGNRWPVPSQVDTYSPARFRMPSPTHSSSLSTQQNSLIRSPSPSCDRPESATRTLPPPTILSPSAQFELLPQSASFDQDAPQTSCFNTQLITEPSPSSIEFSAPQHASILSDKNAFSDQLYFTQPPDTATSTLSFSSIITYSPDSPNAPCAPPARSDLPPEESQGTYLDTRLNVLTECGQKPSETPHKFRYDIPVTPCNVATPNSPYLPTLRAITSSDTTLSSTMLSPSGTSLSVLDELVDSLHQEIDTEVSKDGASNLDNESNGDQSSKRPGIEEAGMELCTTEESRSWTSRQDCPICNGICTLCQMPAEMDRPMRHKLFEFGHRAQELQRTAPNETLRRWIEDCPLLVEYHRR